MPPTESDRDHVAPSIPGQDQSFRKNMSGGVTTLGFPVTGLGREGIYV